MNAATISKLALRKSRIRGVVRCVCMYVYGRIIVLNGGSATMREWCMRELCNWNYILWNYIFTGTHRFMHNAVGAALNFLRAGVSTLWAVAPVESEIQERKDIYPPCNNLAWSIWRHITDFQPDCKGWQDTNLKYSGLQMKHAHEYFCFPGTLGVVAHRFLLQTETCSVEAHLQSYC